MMLHNQFNFYNFALIHHLSISVANSPCLPNVCIVKVFVNVPHISTSSIFFINPNLCLESGIRTFQTLYCAYVSFIN